MADSWRTPSVCRRRKTWPRYGSNAPSSTTRIPRLLMRYVSERGKIVPSRISAVSAKSA